MRKRFYIFLAIIAWMVTVVTSGYTHAKAQNISASYFHSLTFSGNHHHSSINDPNKRLNADRYKVRTKANLDCWEISLPVIWHYKPEVFFATGAQHHSRYKRNEFSTLLVVTALRGPPAVTIFSA